MPRSIAPCRASRWLQAVDLGSELLTGHAAYRLHHGRGRGRRQHAAEMHAVLERRTAANLVAALALMLVTGRILDQSPRGRERDPARDGARRHDRSPRLA